ncbi:proline-rich protein 23D1-like [Saccopteryx leptura]|uniref:proline-rich protein 23D1-like n=1 Tax=Saccopteryx leptura TaxID=249018 RepID=UPI00339BAD8F
MLMLLGQAPRIENQILGHQADITYLTLFLLIWPLSTTYGHWHLRSPHKSYTELKDDNVEESIVSCEETRVTSNPERSRCKTSPSARSCMARPTIEQASPQISSTRMIFVALEPGTELQQLLGDEILLLAPQRAQKLTLSNMVIMAITVHILRSSEDLLFPARSYSLWLQPREADTTWEFNTEGGIVSAQRAEHVHVACLAEAEARIGLHHPIEPLGKSCPRDKPLFPGHPPQISLQGHCHLALLLVAQGQPRDAPSAS